MAATRWRKQFSHMLALLWRDYPGVLAIFVVILAGVLCSVDKISKLEDLKNGCADMDVELEKLNCLHN